MNFRPSCRARSTSGGKGTMGAANAGTPALGGGKRRHRRRGVMAEINVTPMVDVMLVLLIIFMLMVMLSSRGRDVALPNAN